MIHVRPPSGVSLASNPAPARSRSQPRPSHLFTLLLLAASIGGGCQRTLVMPTEEVPERDVWTLARTPADRVPATGQTRVLGTGWYANVELDSQGALHIAFTDADRGDVLYAIWPPGQAEMSPPEAVEEQGAVGSYLHLALAPGDAPVLSYYDQDRRTLRLAHRPRDLSRMKGAGAAVTAVAPDNAPAFRPLVPGERPPRAPADGMGAGWHGEDVAFGDDVGMAGALALDASGRPHLTYYTKNERFRYVRRPADRDAFGATVAGIFDKIDVDERAGGSYTMSTDLLLLPGGGTVVSYCHWNYVDSQLRLGVLGAGDKNFQVIDATPLGRMVDGWHSVLLPASGGRVEVFSVATGAMQLYSGLLTPSAAAPLGERRSWMERPGATVVRRGPDGTLWVLTRGQGFHKLGEEPGVWLVRFPEGDPERATRLLLERGMERDPWLDLVVRADGRPVAVWTSRETESIKMYAP